jgi:hypothetical protein
MVVKLNAKTAQLNRIIKRLVENNEAAIFVDKYKKPLAKMIPVPKPIGRHGRFPVYRLEDIQYLEP